MTISTIGEAQQKAAKVAAIAYLVSFASVVIAQYRIHHILIVDSAAETARNILAHERLFRTGIACDLLSCVALVALLTALYVVLKPVSPGLAMLAAVLRLVYVLLWIRMTLQLFDALRLVRNTDYLQVFEGDRLQALATLLLSERFDEYYVGLLFGALASTVCAYLWLQSPYIPRALAAFGVVSSLFCALCTFVFIIVPTFRQVVGLWLFDTPMGIFDLVTSGWLLFKGLSRPRVAQLEH